jgi:hypothetical protein
MFVSWLGEILSAEGKYRPQDEQVNDKGNQKVKVNDVQQGQQGIKGGNNQRKIIDPSLRRAKLDSAEKQQAGIDENEQGQQVCGAFVIVDHGHIIVCVNSVAKPENGVQNQKDTRPGYF